MPVLALQQQSDWENNVYVLTTTRILVIVGVTYLFRSLYQWARPLMERLPLANLAPWAVGNTTSSYLPPPLLLLASSSSSYSLPPPTSLTSPSHFCMKLVCSLLTLLLIVL